MLQFIDKSKGYSSREEWSDNGNGNFAYEYLISYCMKRDRSDSGIIKSISKLIN